MPDSCVVQASVERVAQRRIEAIRRERLTTLRYGYTEAHHAGVSERGAILDSVTQIAPGGLYVTGQVEVLPGTDRVTICRSAHLTAANSPRVSRA